MDLNESQAERAFRTEVRAFIAANLPKDLKEKAEDGLRLHMADGQRWPCCWESDWRARKKMARGG